MDDNNNSSIKFKNEFNNYLIFTSIKLLNLFGFNYHLPKVPKNHLVKYIEYQIYLQKEKEKKLQTNYFIEQNKSQFINLNNNIVMNNILILKYKNILYQ
jgi:hypothetical protein